MKTLTTIQTLSKIGGVSILNCDDLLKFENEGSVTLGVMFIDMSLLCRHGAELKAEQTTKELES